MLPRCVSAVCRALLRARGVLLSRMLRDGEGSDERRRKELLIPAAVLLL
eukprot:gene26376-5140_t